MEYRDKIARDAPYEPFVLPTAGQNFFNVSALDMPRLIGDQDNLRANLLSYIQDFSPDVRDIFDRFDFAVQVERLHKANLLYLVTEKFAHFDLHPDRVDNMRRGRNSHLWLGLSPPIVRSGEPGKRAILRTRHTQAGFLADPAHTPASSITPPSTPPG